jgi:transcriptional regulator with GAF, ATPase, and Fis domain
VDDLYYHAPPHFNDTKGRPFRSFISVPVRTGETSFGMLSLDSDLAGTCTEVDTVHMILLAMVLGAGLQSHRDLSAACRSGQPATAATPTRARAGRPHRRDHRADHLVGQTGPHPPSRATPAASVACIARHEHGTIRV